MTEYGFEPNRDYRLVTQKRETNNPKNPITEYTDYEISVDPYSHIRLKRYQNGESENSSIDNLIFCI